MEDFDTPPDLIAIEDQGKEDCRSLGRMYAALYQSMREQDVPQSVAGDIVVAYIQTNPASRKAT